MGERTWPGEARLGPRPRSSGRDRREDVRAARLAELLADAICVHATPGVSIEHDGTLACYLQWGAMVDGAGLRIWEIAPVNVSEVVRRYPRVDFKRQLVELMRAEAAAVPGGRFGLLVRCGLPLAARMAPFAD
jgi:hypothetical protein